MDSVDSAHLAHATELAGRGPAYGPNPRVGCVIVSPQGLILGEGWHRGAGTPHAEVEALADAAQRGDDVRGASAYVTLEPCNHTGRTGPCAQALIDAGIVAVRYAVADPNPQAAGGGQTLRDHGVDATLTQWGPARDLNHRWLTAVSQGRPYVIAKWAQTLDGRIAAPDGTSFWITGESARAHVHEVRGHIDAIVVGTGTVLADDPSLSARPGGNEQGHQPLRVVMGMRDTTGARVWRDGNALAATTHDPREVLQALHARDVRTVVVEGGSAVLTAFLSAGYVNELNVYIAPALLGGGKAAVESLGITTMSQALRAKQASVTSLGGDTLITALL